MASSVMHLNFVEHLLVVTGRNRWKVMQRHGTHARRDRRFCNEQGIFRGIETIMAQ